MDFNKILTSIVTAIVIGMLTYIGSTVYELDKRSVIVDKERLDLSAKVEAINLVLQDIYETKGDSDVISHEIDTKLHDIRGDFRKFRIEIENRPTKTLKAPEHGVYHDKVIKL